MFERQSREGVTNINSAIDFTLLDPRANSADIEKLCDIAFKHEYYAVCVNPCNVSHAKGYICENLDNSLQVVTVVGFPLGADSTNSKVFSAREAVEMGADEVDYVINIGKAKNLDYGYIRQEAKKLRKVCKHKILKAIIETCYFDENEIIKLCRICANSGVDYVMSSTGFGTDGANEKIISLMVKAVEGKCYVKASGGIRTREQAIKFYNLGADRIATSSII